MLKLVVNEVTNWHENKLVENEMQKLDTDVNMGVRKLYESVLNLEHTVEIIKYIHYRLRKSNCRFLEKINKTESSWNLMVKGVYEMNLIILYVMKITALY